MPNKTHGVFTGAGISPILPLFGAPNGSHNVVYTFASLYICYITITLKNSLIFFLFFESRNMLRFQLEITYFLPTWASQIVIVIPSWEPSIR